MPPKAPVLRRPLLDLNGAAEYTGFTPRWFRRQIAERKLAIPIVRVNGRAWFHPEDLDRLIASFSRELPAIPKSIHPHTARAAEKAARARKKAS